MSLVSGFHSSPQAVCACELCQRRHWWVYFLRRNRLNTDYAEMRRWVIVILLYNFESLSHREFALKRFDFARSALAERKELHSSIALEAM